VPLALRRLDVRVRRWREDLRDWERGLTLLDRRDLPGSLKGQLEPGVHAREDGRGRSAHVGEPGDRQPAECGCGGAAEEW
jgi:hypothetical protein